MKTKRLYFLFLFLILMVGCANPKADRPEGSESKVEQSSQTTISGVEQLSSQLSEQIDGLVPSLSELFSTESINLEDFLSLFSEKVSLQKKQLHSLEMSLVKSFMKANDEEDASHLSEQLYQVELMKAELQKAESFLQRMQK